MRDASWSDGHDSTADRTSHGDSERLISVESPAAEATQSSALKGYRRIGLGLLVTDVACLSVALLVSYIVRFGLRPLPLDWLITALVAPVVWVLTFHAFRLHAPQHLSNWEEFTRTISASSIGIILIALVSYWSKSSFSRAWVGLTWLSALALELVARRIWRGHIARKQARGDLSFRTLVIGFNEEAKQLLETLSEPGSGFSPLGCVEVEKIPSAVSGVPVVSDLRRLRATVRELGVECLFVASTAVTEAEMTSVVQTARRSGSEIRVSANLSGLATSRLTLTQVGTTMAVTLRPVRLTGLQATAKRIFDLVVAVPILVLLSPVLVAVAIAIRLESPGSTLFKQPRVTRGGRTFTMIKFRTMYQDADRILAEANVDPSVPFFKLRDDPRLTKVGTFIRRWSLDELPQLWNVVRGDMSLVGPRPLPADQVAANPDLLAPRHEVPAGITGWWQVNGRSDVSLDEALRMDLFYIENWSLGLDLYILLKTLGAVVTKKGAF